MEQCKLDIQNNEGIEDSEMLVKFDESRVINSLHENDIVYHAKGFFANNMVTLRDYVEHQVSSAFGTVVLSKRKKGYPFAKEGSNRTSSLFYPIQELRKNWISASLECFYGGVLYALKKTIFDTAKSKGYTIDAATYDTLKDEEANCIILTQDTSLCKDTESYENIVCSHTNIDNLVFGKYKDCNHVDVDDLVKRYPEYAEDIKTIIGYCSPILLRSKVLLNIDIHQMGLPLCLCIQMSTESEVLSFNIVLSSLPTYVTQGKLHFWETFARVNQHSLDALLRILSLTKADIL